MAFMSKSLWDVSDVDESDGSPSPYENSTKCRYSFDAAMALGRTKSKVLASPAPSELLEGGRQDSDDSFATPRNVESHLSSEASYLKPRGKVRSALPSRQR